MATCSVDLSKYQRDPRGDIEPRQKTRKRKARKGKSCHGSSEEEEEEWQPSSEQEDDWDSTEGHLATCRERNVTTESSTRLSQYPTWSSAVASLLLHVLPTDLVPSASVLVEECDTTTLTARACGIDEVSLGGAVRRFTLEKMGEVKLGALNYLPAS